MATKKIKAISMFLFLVVLTTFLVAMSAKTVSMAYTLSVASDNVSYTEDIADNGKYAYGCGELAYKYANDTYKTSMSKRQELYTSTCRYDRWFSYDMGTTKFLRFISIIFMIILLVITILFTVITIYALYIMVITTNKRRRRRR